MTASPTAAILRCRWRPCRRRGGCACGSCAYTAYSYTARYSLQLTVHTCLYGKASGRARGVPAGTLRETGNCHRPKLIYRSITRAVGRFASITQCHDACLEKLYNFGFCSKIDSGRPEGEICTFASRKAQNFLKARCARVLDSRRAHGTHRRRRSNGGALLRRRR